MQTTIYRMDKQQGPEIRSRSSPSPTHTSKIHNLEGWDGVGDASEVQQGGDTCILMADSHSCMADTNTILKSNYPSIKYK